MSDDLFDYASALDAKKHGMADSEGGADPLWSETMLGLVRVVAARQATFTSDDVFILAEARGVSRGTHDGRAFGPVMMRAAKAEWCRKANVAPVNSTRPSLHASPRAVWESLIYRGGA